MTEIVIITIMDIENMVTSTISEDTMDHLPLAMFSPDQDTFPLISPKEAPTDSF
jgi:hypothetical protein